MSFVGELGTTECVDGLQLLQFANCAFKYTCPALWLSAGKFRLRRDLEWKQMNKKTPNQNRVAINLGLKTFFSAERKHFFVELANRNTVCWEIQVYLESRVSYCMLMGDERRKLEKYVKCIGTTLNFADCIGSEPIMAWSGSLWKFHFILMFWETEYEAPMPFFFFI